MAKMDIDAVVDGEIVVMDEAGNPNFQLATIDRIRFITMYLIFKNK
ncbi:MAG: hypothetical protein ACXWTK_04550 [Methylobacter sp.]